MAVKCDTYLPENCSCQIALAFSARKKTKLKIIQVQNKEV